MLAGTKRSPDEVIGRVPYRNGIATVEKIAINAVMAGARPEYFPIIISAMECLAEEGTYTHMMSSEGSFTLMIMVSGPIVREINMNSGVGLLGHGWQANNTIGRAVRLSLINIGYLWPGEIDMALIGRPSSHTFYTFAERNRPDFVWDAAVDGWLLPESPENTFKSGSCNPVSLIVSANLGELAGPGMLVMPFIVPAYIEMLKSVNQQGYNGYACIFDQVPSSWREEGGASVHAIELPYVFGDWDDSTGWWKSIAMFVQQLRVKTANPELSMVDRNVSEAMMALWTSFAKNGKPQVRGIPDWTEYTKDTDQYLNVYDRCEVRTGFLKVAE
jgi:hypothetical protein